MGIEITKFKKYQKNTLQGFADIRLTGVGLEIKEVCVHLKNGKRWLSLPAKPYKKDDGSTGWARMLDFFDKARWDQFQAAALKALEPHIGETGS